MADDGENSKGIGNADFEKLSHFFFQIKEQWRASFNMNFLLIRYSCTLIAKGIVLHYTSKPGRGLFILWLSDWFLQRALSREIRKDLQRATIMA